MARPNYLARFKSWVKPFVNPVRRRILLFPLVWNYFQDFRRYANNMFPPDGLVHPRMNSRQLEGQVTKDYHRIEKALTLPTPRRPFGDGVIARLRNLCSLPEDRDFFHFADDAIAAADEWNREGLISDDVAPLATSRFSGLVNPSDFFLSRKSVRNFSKEPVSNLVLRAATELALSTPSVCNRQTWQIRFLRHQEKTTALSHQNGNVGFGDSAPVVALITVDCRLFSAIGERNQPWIEGGLFSMSFVYALHSLGLSSCLLNMSLSNKDTKRLRNDLGLQDYELPIAMVAIGFCAPNARVARSPRRKIDEVIRFISPEVPDL